MTVPAEQLAATIPGPPPSPPSTTPGPPPPDATRAYAAQAVAAARAAATMPGLPVRLLTATGDPFDGPAIPIGATAYVTRAQGELALTTGPRAAPVPIRDLEPCTWALLPLLAPDPADPSDLTAPVAAVERPDPEVLVTAAEVAAATIDGLITAAHAGGLADVDGIAAARSAVALFSLLAVLAERAEPGAPPTPVP